MPGRKVRSTRPQGSGISVDVGAILSAVQGARLARQEEAAQAGIQQNPGFDIAQPGNVRTGFEQQGPTPRGPTLNESQVELPYVAGNPFAKRPVDELNREFINQGLVNTLRTKANISEFDTMTPWVVSREKLIGEQSAAREIDTARAKAKINLLENLIIADTPESREWLSGTWNRFAIPKAEQQAGAATMKASKEGFGDATELTIQEENRPIDIQIGEQKRLLDLEGLQSKRRMLPKAEETEVFKMQQLPEESSIDLEYRREATKALKTRGEGKYSELIKGISKALGEEATEVVEPTVEEPEFIELEVGGKKIKVKNPKKK